MTRPHGLHDELEALSRLLRLQLRRVERLAKDEEESGRPDRHLHREVETAGKLVAASLRAKVEAGIVQPGRDSETELFLDVDLYSENTIKVLQDPEKRHRIVNLLERLGRLKPLPEESMGHAPPGNGSSGSVRSSLSGNGGS